MPNVAATETAKLRGSGLSFILDPKTNALIAAATPEPTAQPVDESWLRQRLSELGYGALRYLPTAGMVLLARYNSGAAVTVKLAECVDASLAIVLDPDGLNAHLHIQPAEGGAALTQDAVLAALAEQGITQGILPDAIATALAAAASAHPGENQDAIVARGCAPIDGNDGHLQSLLPEARSRVPRVNESGHTDYLDLGEIMVVHPGDALMLRHPPTAGVAGTTLLGEAIPAQPGMAAMYAANLPGAALSADNPDLLLAAITGQPVLVRGGMMVEPLYRVDDVDTSTGNIDFDGSVVIRGDVGTNMRVKASGDIEIGGVVDVATLEAGGSIVVKGGVIGSIGRKGAVEQRIHCGGTLTAGYIQQARIESGDSIFVDDVVMQCELSAINHIRVGNVRRGHIIGGSAQATLSITAKVIGSPKHVRTHLEIGVSPHLHKQMLEMAKDRDAKETQLLEISKLLDFARKNAGKVRPEMLDKARATAATLSEGIAALREEQDLLMKKLELSQRSRVVAQQEIYEGVEVLMGTQRYRVVGARGPAAVGLAKHGLGIMPLEGEG